MKLKRIRPGVWRSTDGRWTFCRQESDPYPKRWFVFERDDPDPRNSGQGHVTLALAVAFADRKPVACRDKGSK